MTTQTKSTTEYNKFKFLIDNRSTARTHINRLKNAIQENPSILEVQPILVNEKMEIIDGQHRFAAASELNLPIHYNQVKGLNIATARDMNVLQRRWTVEDYAISYAKAGNENYKLFNELHRQHPSLATTIIMVVMAGETHGMGTDFRNGQFILKREIEEVTWILEQLESIREITNGEIPVSKPFVISFLQALENEEFDTEEFLKGLRKKPESFHRVSVIRDGLRMIEDIYNFQKSVNLIRLY
jgi:hypothetical protein